MNIFNSLGSNYNLDFVFKSLFSTNDENYKKELQQALEKKYAGRATLLYKGREAIELALKSLDLPLNSFVAINSFTCFAVYEAIKKAGLNVEFLDIEKGELNFSSEELVKHLEKNSKIKVVIIQNTLGYPCDVAQILKICQDNKIILIEDLAHCAGARYLNGQEAGNIGDMTILSFSQDKIIDGISGGALIKKEGTDLLLKDIPIKKQLIDRLYPFFTYLIRKTYPLGIGKILHTLVKIFNLLSSPMDQLDKEFHLLPEWYCNLVNLAFKNLQNNLDHRRKIATIYAQNLNPKIISPKIINSINLSSNLRFPIFVNNRESLIKYLKQSGVYVADIWYDDTPNQCPNAKLAAAAILNLPTSINVSEEDGQNIAQLINQWLKSQ